MKKSLFLVTALVSSALSILLADDHGGREKESARNKQHREAREKQEQMHRESREIHEAVRTGQISHQKGREKLDALNRKHNEDEKQRFWKKVEEKIDGAVRSGSMTRKQADAEYERIKRTQKQKEEVARELHREVEKGMRDLRIAVREGEISEEDAHRGGDEMRKNLERQIHVAHRRIDFEAQESRIYQSIEEGRMSEEDGERRLVEMHRRMELEERRMNEQRGVDHYKKEHRGGRRYWENEEELWDQVARGLKAAVRLGRMSEGEAREIWEEWRNHEEVEDHEYEHVESEEE